MRSPALPLSGPRRLFAVAAILAAGTVAAAHATTLSYTAALDGPSEAPPNASPATGFAEVDIDNVAHTMHVFVSFAGLLGTTTAAHIHAPTPAAGTGVAGVATTTPTFTNFPVGVTSGTFDVTLDMTQAASYNPSFVTANGGTTAGAEAALFQSLADGTAYFNLHSTVFAGGEIRGFLTAAAVPTDRTTWGQTKTGYR